MAYKKRKRADKYEEKLKIDGSFEEAMQALLGVHPKQQNQNDMKSIIKTLTFPANTNSKVEIKIPDTLAENIKIKTEFLSSPLPLKARLSVTIEKRWIKKIPEINLETPMHQFKSNPILNDRIINNINFDKDDDPLYYDTIIVECSENNIDITLKIEIILQ